MPTEVENRRRLSVGALGLALALAPMGMTVVSMAGCKGGARPPAAAPAEAPAPAGLAKTPVSPGALAEYAGSEACLPCHQDLAGQLRTHHYHTMSRADDPIHRRAFGKPARMKDPLRGLTYEVALGAHGPEIVARQGKGVEKAAAEWAFGSGNRAFTYVGDFDGTRVELRLSYFRHAGRWDFTPGQQPEHTVSTPVGHEVSAADAIACVNCHTTAAVVEGDLIRPEKSVLGVGCEGCHGPGKRHIEAVKLGAPDIRMARLAEQRQRTTQELCGSCHRTEETGGDPHSPDTQGQLPRLQGPALALSRCFKESQGRLTCVTCHDPHRDSADTSRAGYNRMCSNCHKGPSHGETVCPRAPKGDCVSCHMPAQGVEMPTSPVFNTHWIKVWKDARGTPARPAR